MAARYEIELVDINDAEALRRAIDAMRRYGRARFVRDRDAVVAVLTPPSGRESGLEHGAVAERPLTADDPLLRGIGLFHGDGPGDVSGRVDRYLAEAYEERHK